MKIIKTLLSLVVLSILLIGCKQEVTTTLFINDIVDAVSTTETITTAGIIKLEMSSSKSCNEKKQQLSNIMSSFFVNLQKIQCTKEGNDDYYYAVFELPLVTPNVDGTLNTSYKGGVSIQLNASGNNIGVF